MLYMIIYIFNNHYYLFKMEQYKEKRKVLIEQINQKEQFISSYVLDIKMLKQEVMDLDKKELEYRLSHPEELKQLLNQYEHLQDSSPYGTHDATTIEFIAIPNYQKKLLTKGLGIEGDIFSKIKFRGHIHFTKEQQDILEKYKLRWSHEKLYVRMVTGN